MKRLAVLLYGIACYALFLGVFVYSITFIGDFWAERTIDSPARTSPLQAAVIDVLLFAAFGLQHGLSSRPRFRAVWHRFVPRSIARSTDVLHSSIAWGTMMYFWQPIPGSVWAIDVLSLRIAAYGLFALGWVAVFVSSHLIDHLELLGLRPVWEYFQGREPKPIALGTPLPCTLMSHPLCLGWITLAWATPAMSVGHLLFAGLITTYFLLAHQLEERSFVILTSKAGSIGVVCQNRTQACSGYQSDAAFALSSLRRLLHPIKLLNPVHRLKSRSPAA